MNPNGAHDDRTWEPMFADLPITEFYSTAYDPVAHVIVGGTQDVGSVEQQSEGNRSWRTVNKGDGTFAETVVIDSSGTEWLANKPLAKATFGGDIDFRSHGARVGLGASMLLQHSDRQCRYRLSHATPIVAPCARL